MLDSYEYNIGDLVVIRHQEDIPDKCLFGWNERMSEWSGLTFVIRDLALYDGDRGAVWFEDMPSGMKKWSWSTDMIQPAPEDEISNDEILEFLQPIT
jgi:hypothetical protein